MEEELRTSVAVERSPVFAVFMRELAITKGISTRTLQQQSLVDGMSDFVLGLAPWYVFATHTFRWNASLRSAGRVYERFMRKSLPTISFFYAVESHPGGHGGHVHAIWDSLEAPRKATHREWLRRYGRNRIEPVLGRADVVDYCSKVCYLLKENRCWWDFHLSPSRYHKALRTVSPERPAASDLFQEGALMGRELSSMATASAR
jgi:hypothetical protein